MLKTGVTLGGIALIGLELWWFLFSRSRNSTVEGEDLTRRIDS